MVHYNGATHARGVDYIDNPKYDRAMHHMRQEIV
jgi:hypothetical protein